MNSQGQIEGLAGIITGVIIVVVLAGILFVTLGGMQSEELTYDTTSYDQFILSNFNVPVILEQNNTGGFSATTPNQTWLDFDGVNDKVDFNDNDDFSGENNLSLCIWAKRLLNDSNDFILGKGSGSNYEYALSAEGDNDVKAVLYDLSGATHNAPTIHNGNDVILNTWYHYCFSNENQTYLRVFRDGKYVSEDTSYSSAMGNGAADLELGRRSGAEYNGSIDDFYLWNGLISPSTVAELYTNSDKSSNKRFIPMLMLHRYQTTGVTTELIMNYTSLIILLDFLNATDYSTITVDDYYNYTLGLTTLPDHPIMLMWDDGYDEHSDLLPQIFDDYGYVANSGIITSLVGTAGYMTWDNITYIMNTKGWGIYSHSNGTCNLMTECNSTQNWMDAFNYSANDIEGNLSYRPPSFVYPQNGWNSTSQTYCDNYYKVCFGSHSNSENYRKYEFAFMNTNLTDGSLKRIEIDNLTDKSYLDQGLNYTISNGYLVVRSRLNENQGTVAYDVSGNANNGAITGATWETDGATQTLTDGTDYSQSRTLMTILNQEYAYSGLNTSYNYLLYNDEGQALRGMTIGMLVVPAVLGLIFIVAIIVLILFAITKIT